MFFFCVVQISVIQKTCTTAVTLSFARFKSFLFQVVSVRRYCSKWPFVCVSDNIGIGTSSPNMFHFLSVVLHRPTPVLKRFNAFHFSRFQFFPLGSCSSNSLMVLCFFSFHLLIFFFFWWVFSWLDRSKEAFSWFKSLLCWVQLNAIPITNYMEETHRNHDFFIILYHS